MLEAVNSVIANAPFLRQNAEQASSARVAVEASTIEAPQAPYVSPYIFINNDYDKAVLQIRDSDTGDVLKQFPSEQTLAARARQAQAESQATRRVTQEAPRFDPSSLGGQAVAAQASSYIEAQSSVTSAPRSRAPSADAVSAAIVSASQSGQASASGGTVSVQA